MERMFHILLYRAFHAQRNYLRPCFQEIGLGAGQPKLLGYLSVHGPCSQRELANYFEVDPAAVSRMLDTLERNGFLLRSEDQADRRADRIQLTEAGRRASKLWQERCRAMEQAMLRGFTDAERGQFADFLSRAHQNLKHQRRSEVEYR